jgi:hypothetical protein
VVKETFSFQFFDGKVFVRSHPKYFFIKIKRKIKIKDLKNQVRFSKFLYFVSKLEVNCDFTLNDRYLTNFSLLP